MTDTGTSGFHEHGVSEVLGTILLIMIVALAVTIVGVFLYSQPRAEKIPSLNAVIWNDNQNVYIRHDGGDPLNYPEIRIYVNTSDVTSKFHLSTAPTQPWSVASIGNVLVYSKGASDVSSVRVVYTGSGSSAVVIAST